MDDVLIADCVGKAFGNRTVLSSASLRVRAGHICVLFGRNGAGKSTLLRIATGVVRADYGMIRFRGKFVARPRLHRLAARGLFLLPDRGLLSSRRTIGEHFDLIGRRFAACNPEPWIERLEIPGSLATRVRDLSPGERKRVQIALAAARSPVCLLADEPLTGLAPKDEGTIGRILRELATGGCGIVLSGHAASRLLDLADDVVWLTGGSTRYLGSPEAALADPSFRGGYLPTRIARRRPAANSGRRQ